MGSIPNTMDAKAWDSRTLATNPTASPNTASRRPGDERPAPLEGAEAVFHILPDEVHGVFRAKEAPRVLKRSQGPEDEPPPGAYRLLHPTPAVPELRLPQLPELRAPVRRNHGARLAQQPQGEAEPEGSGRRDVGRRGHGSRRARKAVARHAAIMSRGVAGSR